MKETIFSILLILTSLFGEAQISRSRLGAWYMYFWNTSFRESQFGLQGDVQHRNWNIIGDLEQLLIRGGLTYVPKKTKVKLTLGYGNVTTGIFGDSDATSAESRIYQEALIPNKIGIYVYLIHRFRYEQRFVEGQYFRTRYRYNLFLNLPFNQEDLSKGAVYLALYNELFINGQKEIGKSRKVAIFDRNRLYSAIGYSPSDTKRIQLGYMRQTTNNMSKGQLQFSFHHTF